MVFIESVIAAFKEVDGKGIWQTVSGIYARVRRAAIGIMLCLGPFNYPFNETYATLIPALLAGNVVIMKIPTVGMRFLIPRERLRVHYFYENEN
jgi:glyceraldehyde-3-phosphate dehydrogenase (NADP+)